MKFGVLVVALFASCLCFAGEQGFIWQGKQYIVYRDGQKVGKAFAELTSDGADRKIANIHESKEVPVEFTQDATSICFYITSEYGNNPRSSGAIGLSCLKR